MSSTFNVLSQYIFLHFGIQKKFRLLMHAVFQLRTMITEIQQRMLACLSEVYCALAEYRLISHDGRPKFSSYGTHSHS